MLFGMFAVLIALMVSGCNETRRFDKAEFTGDSFQLRSESLKEKTPVFYAYMDGSKAIYFFVVKVNGQIESYFDICNSCKQHNRGYRAEEKSIECRDCQITIAYEDLKSGLGSCYPLPLHGKEEGGVYSIERAEILLGRQHFP